MQPSRIQVEESNEQGVKSLGISSADRGVPVLPVPSYLRDTCGYGGRNSEVKQGRIDVGGGRQIACEMTKPGQHEPVHGEGTEWQAWAHQQLTTANLWTTDSS